jgi:hypothetical protein
MLKEKSKNIFPFFSGRMERFSVKEEEDDDDDDDDGATLTTQMRQSASQSSMAKEQSQTSRSVCFGICSLLLRTSLFFFFLLR